MKSVLKVINNELKKLNIPYTFDGWDKDIELPQFIGEISEVPNVNEDGKEEYSFILTGFDIGIDYLLNVSKQLKEKYKTSAIIDGVVIKYDNTVPVDNGSDDCKRIQINLTIKKWSV